MVVTRYYVGPTAFFLEMPLMMQGDLKAWLRMGNTFDWNDHAMRLVSALSAVHARNVVHRDIKPVVTTNTRPSVTGANVPSTSRSKCKVWLVYDAARRRSPYA